MWLCLIVFLSLIDRSVSCILRWQYSDANVNYMQCARAQRVKNTTRGAVRTAVSFYALWMQQCVWWLVRPVIVIAWEWHIGLVLLCSCSGALEYPTTNSCGPINKSLSLSLSQIIPSSIKTCKWKFHHFITYAFNVLCYIHVRKWSPLDVVIFHTCVYFLQSHFA